MWVFINTFVHIILGNSYSTYNITLIITGEEYNEKLKTTIINKLQEVIELRNKEDYKTPPGYANFISFSDVTNSLDLNDIGKVINEWYATRKLNKKYDMV